MAVKSLRDLVKSRFAEFLKGLGFEQASGNRIYYRYRRRLEKRHDIVEVQFDKYQRPKFILNFGKVPTEGLIDSYGRFVKADEVRISQLVEQGRLYSCPKLTFLEHWFGVGYFTMLPPKRAAEAEIEKLIRLFPQVDRWLDSGETGSNVQIWERLHNAPGVAKKALQAKGMWPPEGWTEEDERALRM